MKNLFCTFVLLTSGLLCFSQTDFPRESMSNKQDFTKPEKSQIKTTPVWEVTFEEETPIWTFGSIMGTKTWYVGDTTPTNGYLYQGNPMPPLWFYMGQRYVKDFSVSGNSFAYIDGVSDVLNLFPMQINETYIQFDNIDLTSVENPKLIFYQNFRYLNTAYSYVDFSADGGLTWESVEVNSEVMSSEYGEEYLELFSPVNLAGNSNVSIRFRAKTTGATMAQYGYGWEIDDVAFVDNPDYDVKLVDARMNFFYYDDYHDWFTQDWFHSSSHYGLLPQNEFNNTDLLSRFNVMVKNVGNNLVNPVVNVEIFDPGMNQIFSYSTTFETIEMAVNMIDTVDITETGFYPGVDPELGRYTIIYTVNINGQVDENPSDNSFTAYFEVTDNVISRYLDNTSGSASMKEHDGGGIDGERMAVPMVFNYNDLIYSMDVYIAENTSPGTGIVGYVMRFDYDLGTWIDIASTEMISLDEGNIGGWLNMEFMDPVVINESNDGNSTQLLFGIEFYYMDEANDIFIAYDPNVPSSFWGLMYYYLDGIEPENWFSLAEWNGRGLCLKVNVGGDIEYCPDDMTVCTNDEPIILSELIGTAGAFYGDGIEEGLFYPAIAGEGDYIVINNYEDSQCTFIISVKGMPEQILFATDPIDGVLMPESTGTITITSSDVNLRYWTTINGQTCGDTLSGIGSDLILGTEYSTGTYTLWASNEYGCSFAFGTVSFVENDGITKIVASSTRDFENISFIEGEVNISLFRQYLNEFDELITEIVDEQVLSNQNVAIFNNLIVGNYFLTSTIINPIYSDLAENVFWENSLIFDDATMITIEESEIFFTNVNHPVLNSIQGTNQGGGTVGEQPEGKSLNPLEGKAVILKNSDLNEIIDVAITDETGHYSFPAIPDNTNIQIFVTMPESPVWTAYSCETQTGQSLIIDFIASGNSVYPVIAEVPEQIFVQQRFDVFPNPSTDKIKIESDLACKEVKIFNLQGKLVMTVKSALITTIDVSHLSCGSYILVGIDESNNVGIAKFVKE